MKKVEEESNTSKGFTLLELLVVVIIIGILAAIALPKYQMAIGRAKYATLKSLTKSLAEAKQRYYLINGSYEDITISKLDIQVPAGIYCHAPTVEPSIRCDKEIFGKTISYYHDSITDLPKFCVAFTPDKTDMANRLCQKETGKTANQAYCQSTYCTYYF